MIELIEKRVFDLSEQPAKKRGQERESEERTLLPPLSDELVLGRIWPLLHKRVNVSLLWRLRRVSRSWKEKVGTTVEWAALEMVRVDSPGYLQYLSARHESRPPLRERVEDELAALSVLLAEHLVDYADQTESSWSGTGSLSSIESGKDRFSAGGVPRASGRERIRGHCFACDSVDFERFLERERGSLDRSGEEEIEAYASSLDGSMRVYYPRHFYEG